MLRNGLVAEYLFDGNAEDSSGHEHHGRVEGATPTTNRFDEPNRALAFSGKGDFVVLEYPTLLNPEAFSISIWARYDESAVMNWWNNAIISQDDNGRRPDHEGRVFQLSTMGYNVRIHLMKQAPDVTANHPVQRGVWYHLGVVYDGAYYTFYLNGEAQARQEHTFRPHAEEPIFVGKKNSAEPRFYFHGALDDLRIYNRALAEEELTALYTEHGYIGSPFAASPAPAKKRSSTHSKVLKKPI